MRALLILACCVIYLSPGLSADIEKNRPRFSDYSATKIYRGEPAKPIIARQFRMMRTMIRLGAESDVEFAGHYTIPRWGCGKDCNGFVVVDSISGKICEGFGVIGLPLKWLDKHGGSDVDRMPFQPDSRLLRINACPNETNCGLYDYVMEDKKGLRLIRKELLPEEFQR